MKYLIILLPIVVISCSHNNFNAHPIKKPEKEVLEIFDQGVNAYQRIFDESINSRMLSLDTAIASQQIKYQELQLQKKALLATALSHFQTIVDDYPKSSLYPKSLYNLTLIHSEMGNLQEETHYLEIILESNVNDRESSGSQGIMANPYSNYKHSAGIRLTDIYIEKKEFEKALDYKKKSEKYPYQHFCGNAHAASELYSSYQYAQIYNGLGETDNAINEVLPKVFNDGLANNSYLVEYTVELLLEHYDSTQIRQDFEIAIDGLKKGDDEFFSENCTLNFLDKEIIFHLWRWDSRSEETITENAVIRKEIEKSEFYRKLNGLP